MSSSTHLGGEDEGDVCRVCRSSAEPNHPLYHPCKCSGSIRFVHQDCLMTWLQSSKRKYCELCGHAYAFTKVFDPKMPEHLPPLLFASRLARQVGVLLLMVVRFVLVAVAWLGIVPYIAIWSLRWYILFGNSIAWTITGRAKSALRPASLGADASAEASTAVSVAISNVTSLLSETVAANLDSSSVPAPLTKSTSLSHIRFLAAMRLPSPVAIARSPTFIRILKDTSEGQILTVSLIFTFLAAFLMREWTLQNAIVQQDADGEGGAEEAGFADLEEDDGEDWEDDDEEGEEGGADDAAARDPLNFLLAQIQRDAAENAADAAWRDAREEDEWEEEEEEEDDEEDEEQQQDEQVKPNAVTRLAQLMQEQEVEGFDAKDSFKKSLDEETPLTREELRQARMKVFNSRFPRPASPPLSPATEAEESRVSEDYASYRWRDGRPDWNRPPASPGPTLQESSVHSQSHAVEPPPHSPSSSSIRPLSVGSSSCDGLAATTSEVVASSFAFPQPSSGVVDGASPSYPPLSPPTSTPLTEPRLVPSHPSSRPPTPPIPFLSAEPVSAEDIVESIFSQPLHPSTSPQSSGGHPLLKGKERSTDADEVLFDEAFPVAPQGSSNSPPVRVYPISINPNDERHPFTIPVLPSGDDHASKPPDVLLNVPVAPLEALRLIEIPQEQAAVADDGDDAEKEEEDDSDAGDAPPPMVQHHLDLPPPAAPAGIAALIPPPLDEEERREAEERMMQEDFDGVLEAVGLRGPAWVVAQNSALMSLIISMAIAFTIFTPFVIGKTFLLLNWLDVFHGARLPIRAVRLVTDPALQLLLIFVRKVILPPLDALLLPLLALVQVYIPSRPPPSGTSVPSSSKPFLASLASSLRKTVDASQIALEDGFLHLTRSQQAISNSAIVDVLSIFPITAGLVRAVGDAFAAVGSFASNGLRISRSFSLSSLHDVKELSFVHVASGDTVRDRVVAVAIGYVLVATALLTWYLASLRSNGWAKTFSQTLAQNLIVFKLAFFMLIELVIFPLGCGYLLDACLLPLFNEGTYAGRLAFQIDAPLISSFLHWIGGTLFMFGFASLLSFSRRQLRKGTFYFIRDPNDPSFHPVQEILERRTTNQLVKLGVSAGMYGFLIVFGVGSVLATVRLVSSGLLPLRWHAKVPLSQIPIDLLALHFVLPLGLSYLRPDRRIRKYLFGAWSATVRELRLGAYFFGPPGGIALGIDPSDSDAERDTPLRLWIDWLVELVPSGKDVMRGRSGLVRVPNVDQLAIIPKSRQFVVLDRDQIPLDETESALMKAQDDKTTSAGHDPDVDYAVVFLPAQVRNRIFLLLGAIWLSLVGLLMVGLVIPLFVGRWTFARFLGNACPEVADGYSLCVGLVFVYCGWLSIRSALRKLRRFGQAERVRRSTLSMRIKRDLIFGAQVAELALAFGFVLPLAVGLVAELYLVVPFRGSLDEPPVIFVWETWAFGCVWLGLLHQLAHRLPQTGLVLEYRLFVNEISRFKFDSYRANVLLLFPALGLCLTALLAPLVMVHAVASLPGHDWSSALRSIHARTLHAALAIKAVQHLSRVLKQWSMKVREREFLLELRLRNIDQPEEEAAEGGRDAAAPPGEGVREADPGIPVEQAPAVLID